MSNPPINKSESITIILLAAGSSSRMGQSKQLLEINGEQLLLKSTRLALAADANQVTVVLGANASAHQKIIESLPVQILINEDWQTGMGSSLKKGLEEAIQSTPELSAVLIMVCDQPLLTTDLLNTLIQNFRKTKSKIVASSYSGSAGVPALFEKSLFKELLTLENSSGAKKILERNREIVQTIDFPLGDIDLDTPKDYQDFISKY